jgi:Fe-S-cluster-containing hydrogenase component 2
MERRLVYYSGKCTGCRICEMICSLRHTGTCNPARSRIRITNQKKEGTQALMRCRQCGKPPCIEACPVGALSRDSATGVVSVDFDTCIGCNECIQACPFGGITLDPVEQQIAICDLCGGEPACALFCSTGATQYVRMDRMTQVPAGT